MELTEPKTQNKNTERRDSALGLSNNMLENKMMLISFTSVLKFSNMNLNIAAMY